MLLRKLGHIDSDVWESVSDILFVIVSKLCSTSIKLLQHPSKPVRIFVQLIMTKWNLCSE